MSERPKGKHHSKPRPPRRVRSAAPPPKAGFEGSQRLQKVLAAAGIGSRRYCEELITDGRVEVDHKVVTELGTKVDPEKQEIRLDGEALKLSRRAYYLVNKPRGIISTHSDPDGRPRVIDLLPQTGERLFTVGRLDLESEGLILVTNDGELANRLAHPRYGVQKTYHVMVAGVPTQEVFDQLRKGVYLAEAVCKVTNVKIKSQHKQSSVLEMVLSEGRNREIRRVMAKLGHKVMRLKRVALGPLRLGDMAPGSYRRLSGEELFELRAQGRTPVPRPPRNPGGKPGPKKFKEPRTSQGPRKYRGPIAKKDAPDKPGSPAKPRPRFKKGPSKGPRA